MPLNFYRHDDQGAVDHAHDGDHSANDHHDHRHNSDPIEARGAGTDRGLPEHLEHNVVGLARAAMPGVGSVHDLHVWYMSSERIARSTQLGIATSQAWPQRMMSYRFYLDHVTLQAEWSLTLPAGGQVSVQIRASDGLP